MDSSYSGAGRLLATYSKTCVLVLIFKAEHKLNIKVRAHVPDLYLKNSLVQTIFFLFKIIVNVTRYYPPLTISQLYSST